MSNRDFNQQIEDEMIDWLYIALGAGVLTLLLLAAVCGHHVVSMAVQP